MSERELFERVGDLIGESEDSYEKVNVGVFLHARELSKEKLRKILSEHEKVREDLRCLISN